MALARLAGLYFSARGEPKALFGARFRLQFGHFASPMAAKAASLREPPRHALYAGRLGIERGVIREATGFARWGRPLRIFSSMVGQNRRGIPHERLSRV